jgi:phytoene synthase
LTNFWQDFGVDWRRGRLYVPRDVQQACGASETELDRGAMNPAWACAIEACCRVTREKFDEGRAICDRVRGRLRYELRLTWVGGRRIADLAERRRRDLLTFRPTLGPADLPGMLWQAARWRHAG